jgi:hypothetical protein
MLPMYSYANQRLDADVKTIVHPQIMTRQTGLEFEAGGSLAAPLEPLQNDLVRAQVKYQAIVGDIGKLISHEYPFKQPFLSYEEMQSLRRANPAEYERLYKEGAATRGRYQEIYNVALAQTGKFQAPRNLYTLTPGQAAGLYTQAGISAGVGAGREPTSSQIAQQLTGLIAETEFGGQPLKLGIKGPILPSAQTLQRMGARGRWEDTEVAKAVRLASELIGAYGGGDRQAMQAILQNQITRGPAGEEITTPGLLAEFETLGKSGGIFRKAIGTHLRQGGAVGDVLHMSMALPPTEAYIPQLGDPSRRRGLFGKIAQAIRFPSQMTAAHDPGAGLVLLNREEAERRELNLSVAQFSPEAILSMAGDVDGDKFLAYVRGDAHLNVEGQLVSSLGSVLGNFEIIQKNAMRRAAEGAQSPMADMAGHPLNEKTKGFLSREDAIKQIIGRPDTAGGILGALKMTPRELKGDFQKLADLRLQIGSLYMPFRAAQGFVPEEAQEAFESLWLASHGFAQRPARQLPSMERLHTVLKGALITDPTKWTEETETFYKRAGGAWNPMIPGFKAFEAPARMRGIEGIFAETTLALRDLQGESGESLMTPTGFAALFAGTSEARPGIAKAMAAYLADPLSREASSALLNSVLGQGVEGLATSPIGKMILPANVRRGFGKMTAAGKDLAEMAQVLGVSDAFLQEQLGIAEQQQAMLGTMSRKPMAPTQRALFALDVLGPDAAWLAQLLEKEDPQAEAMFDEMFPQMKGRAEWAPEGRRGTIGQQATPDLQQALRDYAQGLIAERTGGFTAKGVARISQSRKFGQGRTSMMQDILQEFMTGMPSDVGREAMRAFGLASSSFGIEMGTGDQGTAYFKYQPVTGETHTERRERIQEAWDARRARRAGGVPLQANAPPPPEDPPFEPGMPPPEFDEFPEGGPIPQDPRSRAQRRAQDERARQRAGRRPPPPPNFPGDPRPGGGGGGFGDWPGPDFVMGHREGTWWAKGLEPEQLNRDHLTKLRLLNRELGAWTESVKPLIESGQVLNKEQIKYTKSLVQLSGDVDKIQKSIASADQGPLRTAAERMVGRIGERGLLPGLAGAPGYMEEQDIVNQRRAAQGLPPLRPPTGGGGGVGGFITRALMGGDDDGGEGGLFRGGAAGAFRRIFSGWELMRLRRMWAMTGQPVFQQMIPAAGQAALTNWQAAAAVGGVQAGQLPGGVAGGLMAFQAQRQQSMIEAGRRGYQAYGAGILPGLMDLGRQAQAVAGPAIGAGAIATSLASLVAPGLGFGAAAGFFGLPVMGAIGIPAAANYLGGMAAPTTQNQFAAQRRIREAQGRTGIAGAIGNAWADMGPFLGGVITGEIGGEGGFLGGLTGGEGLLGSLGRLGMLAQDFVSSATPFAMPGSGQDWNRQYREWQARQAGQAPSNVPLAQLDMTDRAAAMADIADRLRQQPGWEGMPSPQISQLLAEAYPWDPALQMDMDVEGIVGMGGTPTMRLMRETGFRQPQFQELAAQTGMGAFGGQRILEMVGRMPEERSRGAAFRTTAPQIGRGCWYAHSSRDCGLLCASTSWGSCNPRVDRRDAGYGPDAADPDGIPAEIAADGCS